MWLWVFKHIKLLFPGMYAKNELILGETIGYYV